MSVVRGLVESLDMAVTIYDLNETILFASGHPHAVNRYAIETNDRILGWVCGPPPAQSLASTLSYIAQTEFEKKSLAIDALDKYEEINFLYDISTKLASCVSVDAVAQAIIEEARKPIAATCVAVLLRVPLGGVVRDRDSQTLKTIAFWSENPQCAEHLCQPYENLIRQVLQSGQAEVVNHLRGSDRDSNRQLSVYATICAPLKIQEQIIGIVNISNSQPIAYTAQDLKLFTALTSQAAAAIDNALLYDRLKDYAQTLEVRVAQRTADLEKVNHELHRLATLDGLTQVANRRQFDQYLEQEWRRLSRENSPLSLVFCDIDYFKPYNDTYGHLAGDECLRRIARAIQIATRRPADLVARYGGEEFAAILPNTTLHGAWRVAQTMRSQIEQLGITHKASQVSAYVTASLGVSCLIPQLDLSPNLLVNAADRAVYEAKRQGRNCVYQVDLV